MKKNVFNLVILGLGLLFLGSCSDDEDNKKLPLNVKEIVALDLSNSTVWTYFSFEKGFDTPVGTGSVNPEDGDDAKWKTRTDWDIALHSYDIRTNGGTSGNGKGGITKQTATTLAGVTVAPESGYTKDTMGRIMTMTKQGHKFYPSSISPEIAGWAKYDHKERTWNIKPFVIVVKTGNGKYVKMHVKNYLNKENKSGYLTFDYVYQNDGSTNLK